MTYLLLYLALFGAYMTVTPPAHTAPGLTWRDKLVSGAFMAALATAILLIIWRA